MFNEKEMKKLTENQKKVCDIIGLMELSGRVNHTKAYQMVYGSKKKTAESGVSRMLRNGKVLAYLTRARARVKRVVEKTEAEIIREYEKMAFVNMGDFYHDDGTLKTMKELTREQKAAIKSISTVIHDYTNKKGVPGSRTITEIQTQPKKGALDSLARIKGMMKGDAKEIMSLALAAHEALKDRENEEKSGS